MDTEQLRRLKPDLERFLAQFDDCFSRESTRRHLPVYVEGQLSDLPEKTVAPIAKNAQMAPRTLQEFLSLLRWDHDRMQDRLEKIVAEEYSGPHSIGVLDETSFVKKGDKTPGVQRQWCGAVGKTENCVVTVHLGYAKDEFHCLLDGELFLPESWAADPKRCQEAGIPEGMIYRPKWQIGLELYDRAVANGLRFEWITADEGYGGKPGFLDGLNTRNQCFIVEVPTTFTGWIDPPHVTHRPYRRHRGRGRKSPRLVAGSPKARSVAWLLKHHPALRDQAWQTWRVKDGEKGPMLWDAKHCPFYPKMGRLPMKRHHLVIARNVLKPEEIKFFVSNAPPETSLECLLLAGFSRWHVERCFEDEKGEVGLDHYEGRCYVGWKRHLAISAVSHLFLAQVLQTWAEKKSRRYDWAGADRGGCNGAAMVVGGTGLDKAPGEHSQYHPRSPADQGQIPAIPHQADAENPTATGHQTHQHTSMRMGHKLAL